MEIYGDTKRVIVSYPTGFSGYPVRGNIHGIDPDGTTYSKTPAVEWESAFVRELRHFHACITEGEPCYTALESARHDIALIIDVVRCYGLEAEHIWCIRREVWIGTETYPDKYMCRDPESRLLGIIPLLQVRQVPWVVPVLLASCHHPCLPLLS